MSNLREVINNEQARALFREVDEWLAETGTSWSTAAAKLGVVERCKSRVMSGSRGLNRTTAQAIRRMMARHPDGLGEANARNTYLGQSETAALVDEMRAWLERTGTPLSLLANTISRSVGGLQRMLDCPVRIGHSTAAKIRELMAANPDEWAPPHNRNKPWLVRADSAPVLTDPLADRRGEAERMRKQWVAQQAAEHQRKYGRPMGRSIEEMAA